MSGDPDQEYFADGLTEDIITDLSKFSALSVVARHTAFTFKGGTLHMQQVARDLKVNYVLEGSVRKADGHVRVTAQLIDGATGDHRWAHRYDRRLDDIFALQDEISRSIVDVLRVTLLPEELEVIAQHPTADTRAYEYYLMGRSFYLRGMDKRCLGIARDMYAKATELDPGYARGYAGLAICNSYVAASGPDGYFETARANSARALALEPNLAEAYAAKGLALYAATRFGEATVEFERAMRLDPGLFEAHFFHGRNCRNQGLRAESAALFARAAELRPDGFPLAGPVGMGMQVAWAARKSPPRSGAAWPASRRRSKRIPTTPTPWRSAARSLLKWASVRAPRTGRPAPSFWARTTASSATTRPSPMRCSAGWMLRWITWNRHSPRRPPFDAAWRRG